MSQNENSIFTNDTCSIFGPVGFVQFEMFEYKEFRTGFSLIKDNIGNSDRYKCEVSAIPITFVLNDPFNHDRTNISASFILQGIFLNHELSYTIPILFNSKHYMYFIQDNCYKNYSLSFFFKQQTEFFVFRKNRWIGWYPGIGTNLCIKQFSMQFGVNKSYYYNFKKSLSGYNYFMSVGIYTI
jgi:hypothetical protein